MTLEQAISILGPNKTRYEMEKICASLAFCLFSRSPAEIERFDAASYALRHWQRFRRECNARRDFVPGRV